MLDSSFLIAFHNTRDVHHEPARGAMERLLSDEWGRPLLLEYVFLEVVTVLRARRSLTVAVEVGEKLLGAREIDFVPCAEIFLDAFAVFRRQRRVELSFADAAIVAIARQRQARWIATFDADFGRVGGLSVVPSDGGG